MRGRRVPLYLWILSALVLGLVLGPALGRAADPLGEMGKVVIQLIKAVAAPLLFFAILNAILKTQVAWRQAGRLFFFAAINACIALGIGMLLSNTLQPGRHLTLSAGAGLGQEAASWSNQKLDVLETLKGYIPSNFITPFAQNSLITIVLIALLLGFGLRLVRSEQQAAGATAYQSIEDGVSTLLRVMEVVLGWVILLIPLAVFGVVAKTTGEHGYAPLKGLGVYVLVGLFGMGLHVLTTYQLWVKLYAGIDLRRFWRAAREPVVVALGTNSSLATLPVTLRGLDELQVDRSASALGACVGTNLNNDGIILYEGMALLFIAQAAGIELSAGDQLLAAGTALMAAMGVAGVPEAGFVSLALVLGSVGLPTELLPLLLTVDWIIARGRSVTNVLSDMVLSILIDRSRARGAVTATQ